MYQLRIHMTPGCRARWLSRTETLHHYREVLEHDSPNIRQHILVFALIQFTRLGYGSVERWTTLPVDDIPSSGLSCEGEG